jgi:hypothetical protein
VDGIGKKTPNNASDRIVNPGGLPNGQGGRVCRAWHRACEVKDLAPGNRGAEGKQKGKGIVARRGLEEARSKSAGRGTGIPPKAGCGTLGGSPAVAG